MPMDGCFIHYLTTELVNTIKGARINKITNPTPNDIILNLKGKENYNLLLSLRLDAPRIYLTNEKFINPETPSNFCMVLRKYLDRGIIKDIKQYQNDRIIELHILKVNELEDEISLILLMELMGRNSNIILLKNDYTIIDAARKMPPSNDAERTILPHAKYFYKESDKNINPFTDNFTDLSTLQGVSKPLMSSIEDLDDDEIIKFINQDIHPVIYKTNNKLDFYAYPLSSDLEIVSSFNTLSEMLEHYDALHNDLNNYHASELLKLITKEKKKALHKLNALEDDLKKANENLIYNDLGILLQTNLYKVRKGDTEIIVDDFLHDNKEITLILDPLLDPKDNLKLYFTKAKKAKTSLIETTKQLEITKNDLVYFEELEISLSYSDKDEIEEIKKELVNLGYLKNNYKFKNKKQKIKLNQIELEDVIIYIGKNNLQNDYLTHTIARSNDYWFHVKDIPGSHIIVKIPNNDPDYKMSENIIRTAANYAASFSKAATSSSVPVDYTKVRYIKKIPGIKGYHVTYTNQHTIYIDPDKNKKNDI